MTDKQQGENQALIEYLKDLEKNQPRRIDVTADGETVPCIVDQRGQVEDLRGRVAPYLAAPRRLIGTARFTDQTSFEGHAKRFMTSRSTLWASLIPAPSLVSVLNYHENADAPAHCDHRGCYTFPLSDEWQTWTHSSGIIMSQAAFAAFLEERAQDLVSGTKAPDDIKAAMERIGKVLANPLDLVILSKGLRVNVDSDVVNAQDNSSGEVEIAFKSTHTTKAKDGSVVRVPGAFVLQIPVFQRGGHVTIAAFLRYRVKEGAITWSYELYRPHVELDAAFHEVCESAARSTQLPLFFGQPEV